jgi:chorismate-pyruvate lyase
MSSVPTVPDLHTLIGLFYDSTAALGEFVEVQPEQMPPLFCELLAHENHMTVTVEAHHGSPVNVQVLNTHTSGKHYAREILLARQSDGHVVQYGIMRVNFEFLSEAVREEIESQRAPLGRILIENDVLRAVQLSQLWKISAAAPLCQSLDISPGVTIYGRTAIIHCNGEPAIELLEIVTPD